MWCAHYSFLLKVWLKVGRLYEVRGRPYKNAGKYRLELMRDLMAAGSGFHAHCWSGCEFLYLGNSEPLIFLVLGDRQMWDDPDESLNL
jgi:hypothetical protein